MTKSEEVLLLLKSYGLVVSLEEYPTYVVANFTTPFTLSREILDELVDIHYGYVFIERENSLEIHFIPV